MCVEQVFLCEGLRFDLHVVQHTLVAVFDVGFSCIRRTWELSKISGPHLYHDPCVLCPQVRQHQEALAARRLFPQGQALEPPLIECCGEKWDLSSALRLMMTALSAMLRNYGKSEPPVGTLIH